MLKQFCISMLEDRAEDPSLLRLFLGPDLLCQLFEKVEVQQQGDRTARQLPQCVFNAT